MIHEVGRELEAKLLAKGCPFKVVDRENSKPTAWRNIIVIEETGDTYQPASSQSRNPKRYFDGRIGAKLTVYAQSTKTGALEFEHRRIARRVVDHALIALRTIRAERMVAFLGIGAGRFVPIEDLAASERPGGCAYELLFTIDRGVADLNWVGEAAPEATLASYAMVGAPTLTFAAADSSITRSAGSWVTDGFAVGMTVRIGGSTSNDVAGAIETITALVITLAATPLTDEGPVTGCTVEAGGFTHTTNVYDSVDDITPEAACGA